MLLVETTPLNRAAAWIKAAPMALICTVGLFVFMERLIAISDYPIDETEDTVIPEVAWEEPPEIETRKKMIEKIVDPVEPPEIPESPQQKTLTTKITIPKLTVKTRGPVNMNVGISGNFPIPKIMSSAVYPRRALMRGIEGYVDLRFDVSAIGMTENIEVLAANPNGIFEDAAVKAAKKWRFQPVMKDGEGQPFVGMSKRVTFEIQE